jgi:hypothetical protein
VVKVKLSGLNAEGGKGEMVKVANVRWSKVQASQMVKIVRVGWSNPRSNSQGQMVKMVKSVKVIRWSRWLRWSCSDGGGGQ